MRPGAEWGTRYSGGAPGTPGRHETSRSDRFLVALLGARMHYAVPRILHEAGRLERLFTDSCAVKGLSRCLAAIPRGLRPHGIRRLLARVPTGIPANRITCFERLGWQYAWKRARAAHGPQLASVFLWANRRFGELVCRSDWGRVGAVFTFNTAGLEVLRSARARGLRTVMEQTIAPRMVEEELLAAERAAFPGWEDERRNPLLDAWCEREAEEWRLADAILCGLRFREGRRPGVRRAGRAVRDRPLRSRFAARQSVAQTK